MNEHYVVLSAEKHPIISKMCLHEEMCLLSCNKSKTKTEITKDLFRGIGSDVTCNNEDIEKLTKEKLQTDFHTIKNVGFFFLLLLFPTVFRHSMTHAQGVIKQQKRINSRRNPSIRLLFMAFFLNFKTKKCNRIYSFSANAIWFVLMKLAKKKKTISCTIKIPYKEWVSILRLCISKLNKLKSSSFFLHSFLFHVNSEHIIYVLIWTWSLLNFCQKNASETIK